MSFYNSEAQKILVKNSATDGYTIITDKQTAGRGQRGNQWEAQAGENLTLSVIWQPTFLAAADQFQLSQAVALAVHDWAATLLGPGPELRVKWPNDILYLNQKLGGILIENTLSGAKIHHSIVGIGFNVNQRAFAMPTASSIGLITGRTYALPLLATRLLECLERRYLQLRAGQHQRLQADYLRVLYRYQQLQTYQVDGQVVQGTITGVDATGRLLVTFDGRQRAFGLQEIKHVF